MRKVLKNPEVLAPEPKEVLVKSKAVLTLRMIVREVGLAQTIVDMNNVQERMVVILKKEEA